MAPRDPDGIKILYPEQVKLLIEVLKRTQKNIKASDWDEIANEMKIVNGGAVRKRFRYMMNHFETDKGLAPRIFKPKTRTTKPKHAASARSNAQDKKCAAETEETNHEIEKAGSNMGDTRPFSEIAEHVDERFGLPEIANQPNNEELFDQQYTMEEYRQYREFIQAFDQDDILIDMEQQAHEEDDDAPAMASYHSDLKVATRRT